MTALELKEINQIKKDLEDLKTASKNISDNIHTLHNDLTLVNENIKRIMLFLSKPVK